ncbi:MAG: RNA-directed DNA polymerase [Magnetococcales bacterium]|nr:RNA-directed DNA polymerase [Magnetococcales bacterium]MBF0322488.1 RNA-directed DNA polymerase [Magnetococcales bacterium]
MNRHPLNQSPFFKLRSRKKLANILGLGLKDLEVFAQNEADENYRLFEIRRGGKARPIQWPIPCLQRIHKRVCDLLARIETPNYLHSAIKGRSYLSNAKAHSGDTALVKVDIRKFFPSVTVQSVKSFFLKTMGCSPDVAAVLSKVLTVYGHLPTGSSVSPILSFYAHLDMFGEIEQLARKRGAVMTCYVDDMCFSGRSVTRKFLYEVRLIIHRHGLKTHKIHCFAPGVPRIVTGVVVTGDGMKLPNKRHQAIAEDFAKFQSSLDEKQKLKIFQSLLGRVNEASQIEPRWKNKATSLCQEVNKMLYCGRQNDGC